MQIGWYEEGTKAAISVTSPIGLLIQQAFACWSGDVASTSSIITVSMDSPKTAIAEWREDYMQLLTLAQVPGLVSEEQSEL